MSLEVTGHSSFQAKSEVRFGDQHGTELTSRALVLGCSGQLPRPISWPGSLTFPGRPGAVCPSRPPRHAVQLSSARLFSGARAFRILPRGDPSLCHPPPAWGPHRAACPAPALKLLHLLPRLAVESWGSSGKFSFSPSKCQERTECPLRVLGRDDPASHTRPTHRPDGSSSCSTFTESVCRTQGGGKLEGEKNRH